jgi:hypothetical protein
VAFAPVRNLVSGKHEISFISSLEGHCPNALNRSARNIEGNNFAEKNGIRQSCIPESGMA